MKTNRRPLLLIGLIVWSHASALWAQSPEPPLTEPHAADGEERFFSQCPARSRIRVHHDASAADLHAVMYTTASLMELEIIRLADWLIDLPLPGTQLRPLERGVNGIRAAYHHLGNSRPIVRVGELVDALQLPELSLGDVTMTYTVATGGTMTPGGGTVVRVNKLIDWTQHLVGDVNELGGRLIGLRRGLIGWTLPGRVVDGLQQAVTRIFHGFPVTVARVLDRGIVGVEWSFETLLNLGRATRHHDTTVFLRLPTDVYRAHEQWVLTCRRQIYVGTAEELAHLTHADLFHPRTRRARPRWWALDRLPVVPASVVLVTDLRTFANAPQDLRAYVVPAAWVLNPGTEP